MALQKSIIKNNFAPAKSKKVTLADDGATTNSNTGNALIGDMYPNMIWIDTAGAVKLIFADGTNETFPAMLVGQWHFMAPFKNVESTGTTPTDVHVGVSFMK